jgi:hypothetical protein
MDNSKIVERQEISKWVAVRVHETTASWFWFPFATLLLALTAAAVLLLIGCGAVRSTAFQPSPSWDEFVTQFLDQY